MNTKAVLTDARIITLANEEFVDEYNKKDAIDFARAIEAAVLASADNPSTANDELQQLRRRVSELEAARIAYANEFPLTADGDPDVGNIHANIRALKAKLSDNPSTAGTAPADWLFRSRVADLIHLLPIMFEFQEGDRATGAAALADVRKMLAAPLAQSTAGAAKGDYVLMPKRLTAENGAKGALSGEFHEYRAIECPDCIGNADDSEDCPECNGEGKVLEHVTVEWDTIKRIYASAVDLLAAPAPHAQPEPAAQVQAELTDEAIDEAWNSMPGGADGWLKQFGYRQLARAIARHALARVAASMAGTIRPTDDELWEQTIGERDHYHDMADKLAEAIAKHFGVEIGEHSNMNCPWHEALDAIASSAAQVPTAAEVCDQALEEVAKLIEKKVEDYDRDHGSYDHTTGVTEYPGDGAEWVEEMGSLADEIRALRTTSKEGGAA